MHIGIAAYLLHGGQDYRAAGVSTYTRQLLEALPAVAPKHSYTAFVGSDAPAIPGIRPVVSHLPTYRPEIRIVWEQLGLPLQAQTCNVALLHGTVNVLPGLFRGPSVVTVHDLSFIRHPERLSRRRSLYLEWAVERSARKATCVIAVSRNTARDLVELFGADEDRIRVVYPGVDASFRPLGADPGGIRQRHFGGRPFILHVGTLEPRKNQDVLIRAYGLLRRRLGVPHTLALVGARGWMYESLFTLVDELGLREDVSFLDFVAPADLPLWYNAADLFAYPSAYEGFGLPVLEAMACGLATITSSTSSLRELAGQACLTVEPGSEEELCTAMARVLEDAELRGQLRAAGLERAAEFSWTRTARETADVYEMVGGS